MKKGQLIKIIADFPADGQCTIRPHVGKKFRIRMVHKSDGKETGEISIDVDGKGLCILNRGEYIIVKK